MNQQIDREIFYFAESTPEGEPIGMRKEKSLTHHIMPQTTLNTYTINVEKCWFDFLKNGQKTVEGKKASPAWENVKTGDVIIFQNGSESFKTIVTKVNKYSTLRDYFVGETLEKTLPGVETIADGENVYSKWWSEDEIKKYGVLGISVKLV